VWAGDSFCFLLLTADFVDLLDEEEESEGDNEKADGIVEEETVVDGGRPGGLGICQ